MLFRFYAVGQVTGDYRAAATGTWATPGNWETFNGTSWVVAGTAPSTTSNVITIRSPFTITISASVSADQIVIDPGATLQVTAGTFTIANGTGVDLTINGTFQESGSTAVAWGASATWQMGANGTLIKTTNTSSNNWQSFYQGGISTIPATSNWIIRRNTAVAIPISTTTPASGSVYPNLTIENNVAGTWIMPAGSSFSGSATFATIKGNLDIGGSGTSTVDFLNSNTNASPALVMGNMTVRTGNFLRNYGTGFEVRGDLTVSGTVNYDLNDARLLVFSGTNNQSVSGTGTLNVYSMTVNKLGGSLTLNRPVTVDQTLTMTNGIVNTTSTSMLIVNTAGNVVSASNSSFISGPVRYTGSSAFTFPVGKGSDYQPLGISASAGVVTFWTETFDGAVCSMGSGCDPSMVSWTSVGLGGEGSNANKFYVSCTENGNAAGACGSGCGSDQSLHVGNVSTSSAAGFWCPAGDCGASYDASGSGEITNKRAESPVINCSGRSNIYMSFNYMENGQGSSDNATVWYYDGSAWAQIDDPGKVTICGSGQGTWTNRSIQLPASADNNPNVKIGFVWVNNGDGTGNDPSFAVDDITLYTSSLADFTCEYFNSNPQSTYGNNLAPTLNNISMCEYWILTRNAGNESKNVTLSWDGNSCGVGLLSDLRVARYDGISTWQDQGNTATIGNTTAGTITSGLVTSFSPFTLSSVSGLNPLPVELLSFTAELNASKTVDLKWTTATETNSDYFTIERSRDGNTFEEVIQVRAAGNSTQVLNYSTIDPSPYNGLSYYRLKQTDFNGQFVYSALVPVEIHNGDFEVVSTATYDGQIEVIVNCGTDCLTTFELFDVAGRKIVSSQKNMEGDHTKWNASSAGLSKGAYLLKVQNGNKQVSKKIIL